MTTELILAVKAKKSYGEIEAILKAGNFDVNATDDDENTALHCAVFESLPVKTIKLLLDYNVEPLLLNSKEDSALALACMYQENLLVKALCEKMKQEQTEAVINRENISKKTPLWLAIEQDSVKNSSEIAIEALLKHGAKPDQKTFVATFMSNKISALNVLLEKYQNISEIIKAAEQEGKIAGILEIAMRNKFPIDTFRWLIAKEAMLTTQLFTIACTMPDNQYLIALSEYCRNNKITAPLDVPGGDYYRESVLYHYLYHYMIKDSQSINLVTFQALLEAGAQVRPELVLTILSIRQLPHLCLSILIKHLDNQQKLKALIKEMEEKKKYPLSMAIEASSSADVLTLLIQNGANCDISSKEGTTPLCQAISKHSSYYTPMLDVIDAILTQSKETLEQPDSTGETPLQHVIKRSHDIDLFNLLVKHGAKLNTELPYEKSCLADLAVYTSFDVVKAVFACCSAQKLRDDFSFLVSPKKTRLQDYLERRTEDMKRNYFHTDKNKAGMRDLEESWVLATYFFEIHAYFLKKGAAAKGNPSELASYKMRVDDFSKLLAFLANKAINIESPSDFIQAVKIYFRDTAGQFDKKGVNLGFMKINTTTKEYQTRRDKIQDIPNENVDIVRQRLGEYMGFIVERRQLLEPNKNRTNLEEIEFQVIQGITHQIRQSNPNLFEQVDADIPNNNNNSAISYQSDL